jgi:hypothetical protein
MAGVDVVNDPALGLRTGQGVTPAAEPGVPTDGGEAIWGAAFRQTNSVVSALQYMRNSGHYAPEPDYNPIDDLKSWEKPSYMLDHGRAFVGSQSRAESQAIKAQIDQEETDRSTLAANGKIGFVAQTMSGLLDPTLLLPGGVALDAAKGGLSFSKAAVTMGKAGLMQTTAQEALLQGTQQTREWSESAINVGTGTLLTALLGGAAVSMLSRGERAAIETKLHADRAEMNEHAGNPSTGETPPKPAQNITENIPEAANTNEPAGTGMAASGGAAASDTRQIELVDFGLNQIPGVRTVVEKTSPMQRLFGADSVTARRTAADLAETPLLMKENLQGGVTTAGPALDRQARLHINQGQVQVGDELSRLFSEYRFGEQKAFPRARGLMDDLTGRAPEGKMSFDEFKEAVTDAARNGEVHENPQVTAAAQFIRSKVFDPWKKRAIDSGLLPEDVAVKTADSYVQRLYNKQAIAAKRPEFVERITDWLAGDQATKAEAKTRIDGLSRQLSEATDDIESATAKLAKMKDDDLFRGGIEDELIRANAAQDRARTMLEKEVAAWEGKSVAEAKSALKARAKAEESRAPDAKRLTAADKAIDKAAKRIIKSDRDLSRDELRSRAQEITDRIIGSPDGRLPYDLGMEHGTGGGGSGAQPRGPLAAREFNIPDATIKDFLENDIEHIVGAHLRTMVPDVLLTEKFGDLRMTESFRKINDEYAALIDGAKSEKERTRLEKERQGVISDLAGVRDRIQGTYGVSSEARAARCRRGEKLQRADVDGHGHRLVVARHGWRCLPARPELGLSRRVGAVRSYMMGSSDAWKEAAGQFRAMGIATEMTLAQRAHALSDVTDTYRPQSRVERTLQWGATSFSSSTCWRPGPIGARSTPR